MSKLQDVEDCSMPCWYQLSWHKEPPAIVLLVHKDFVANTQPLTNTPFVLGLKTELGFTNFEGSLLKNFGFDNALKNQGEDGEFIKLAAELPQKSEEICNRCKGTGKSDWREERCPYCRGTGKVDVYDWQGAYAISASFKLFFVLARFPKKETSSTLPQLLEITYISTRKEQHGGSLGGIISFPLRQWLASIKEPSILEEVVGATKNAFDWMQGIKVGMIFHFGFRTDGLIIDCPGDRTGIHPLSWHFEEGKGYEFDCHNVDTPFQQITLLAGLAALHDRARKEGVGT